MTKTHYLFSYLITFLVLSHFCFSLFHSILSLILDSHSFSLLFALSFTAAARYGGLLCVNNLLSNLLVTIVISSMQAIIVG